jgi:hypothetical protein
MKTRKFFLIVFRFFLLLLVPAYARAQTVRIANLKAEGDGCRNGRVTAITAPDGSSFSLLFDEFSVEAGGVVNKAVASRSCRVRFDVQVPVKKKLKVLRLDYRGFASLPKGAKAYVNTAHGMQAVGRNPVRTQARSEIGGAAEKEFLFTQKVDSTSEIDCGKKGAFDLDVKLGVEAYQLVGRAAMIPIKGSAVAFLDSIDGGASVTYLLQLKSCD